MDAVPSTVMSPVKVAVLPKYVPNDAVEAALPLMRWDDDTSNIVVLSSVNVVN